jgi:hypothetical protein
VADVYGRTVESVIETQNCHQMARNLFGAMNERLALLLTETIDREMRWKVASVAWPLFETVDLVNSVSPFEAPFLYVPSTIGGEDLERLVRRVAPSAEIDSAPLQWPVRMADPESGHEFAQRVRKFVRDHQ